MLDPQGYATAADPDTSGLVTRPSALSEAGDGALLAPTPAFATARQEYRPGRASTQRHRHQPRQQSHVERDAVVRRSTEEPIDGNVTLTPHGDARAWLHQSRLTEVSITSTCIDAAVLPARLRISRSGAISGTPAAPGTWTVSVTAADGHGAADTASFVWTVT